jgi:hypothetical protein
MASRHLRSADFMALQRDIIRHGARVVGISDAQAQDLADQVQESMLQALQGTQVYMGGRHLERNRKAARAVQLRQQGYSPPDIAARLGVSVPHAYRLMAQACGSTTPAGLAGAAGDATAGAGAAAGTVAQGASPLRGVKPR